MADVEALRAQIEGLQVELKRMEEAKDASSSLVAPYSRSFSRTPIATVLKPSSPSTSSSSSTSTTDNRLPLEGNLSLVGAELVVGGWVRTGREAGAGSFAFLEVNDGSCQGCLQVLVPADVAAAAAAATATAEKSGGGVFTGLPASESSSSSSSSSSLTPAAALKAVCSSGACILVKGTLVESPEPEEPGKQRKQAVELKATELLHVGACDNGAGAYPLAGKKRHTLEHLRDVAHLRPRTATFGAVARVRSALAAAAHEFFQSRGFHYVTSPLITASDCEGAGEMFQVTTLLGKADELYLEERKKKEGEGGSGGAGAGAGEASTSSDAAAATSANGDAAAAAPSTSSSSSSAPSAPSPAPTASPEEIAALEAAAKEVGDRVRALKAAKAPKEEVELAVASLKEAKARLAEASGVDAAAAASADGKEKKKKDKKGKDAAAAAASAAAAALSSAPSNSSSVVVGGLPRSTLDHRIDYSQDFFGKPAFLTVSGQLNAEYYACALTSVYTFGPTFRAENSHTSRHLAEFWMIEPEIAFADLWDDMRCAEDFVLFCVRRTLEKCSREIDFLENGAKVAAQGTRARLEALASPDFPGFARVSYTEAVEMLKEAIAAQKAKFELPVEWGVDLASEHERYLVEVIHAGRPVIVYDYPKEIKAFYMRANDDGKTVAAMDVLVPGVGELVGGSQREERLEVLLEKLEKMGAPTDASSPYNPYLDLRRYGRVPHAGFGVGFERLVQFVSGLDNIRDAIPFPRWPNNAAF